MEQLADISLFNGLSGFGARIRQSAGKFAQDYRNAYTVGKQAFVDSGQQQPTPTPTPTLPHQEEVILGQFSRHVDALRNGLLKCYQQRYYQRGMLLTKRVSQLLKADFVALASVLQQRIIRQQLSNNPLVAYGQYLKLRQQQQKPRQRTLFD